ncbi:MAG: hypothetical protein JWM10_3091 [Myxococcaceae bacterium]|nr:hypothetical protein [Myxococcaceae bacterium]
MNQRVLRAVDVELTAAAAERWVAPVEGFLWRARRCAEAMLYALLVEAKVDVTQLAEQGKGLDNLAKHARLQGEIPRELRNHLESVQKYGNTAAHFQADGPASDASAIIVANALSDLGRWFFTRDGKPPPDALAAPLAALIDERQRLRAPAELALQQEQQRADELRRRLDDAARPAVGGPPPPFTARLAAIGAALAVIGGAVGFGAGRSTAPAAATIAVTPTLITPPAGVATPATELPAEVTPPSAAAADAPDAAVVALSCPRGMLHVGPAAEPGAFCIDAAPVKEGEYRRCVTAGRCPHPPPVQGLGVNWNLGAAANDYAANFLPWSMALAYCQQRAPGGGLPTRLEWRAVATHHVGVRLVPGTREWSDDESGGAVRPLRGAARGATDYAWSALPPARGYRDVGFRCALRAVSP